MRRHTPGHLMRIRRVELGFNQTQAAQRASLHMNIWHRLETDRRTFRGNERWRIARALRTTVKALWGTS